MGPASSYGTGIRPRAIASLSWARTPRALLSGTVAVLIGLATPFLPLAGVAAAAILGFCCALCCWTVEIPFRRFPVRPLEWEVMSWLETFWLAVAGSTGAATAAWFVSKLPVDRLAAGPPLVLIAGLAGHAVGSLIVISPWTPALGLGMGACAYGASFFSLRSEYVLVGMFCAMGVGWAAAWVQLTGRAPRSSWLTKASQRVFLWLLVGVLLPFGFVVTLIGRIGALPSRKLAGLDDFLERSVRRLGAAFSITSRGALVASALCAIAIPISLVAPRGPRILMQAGAHLVAAWIGCIAFREYRVSGEWGESAPRAQFTRTLPIHTVRQGLTTLLCGLALAAPCLVLSGSAYGLNVFLSGAVMSAGLGFLPTFVSALLIIPFVWLWATLCSDGPWVLAVILSLMTLFAFDSACRARSRSAIRRWGLWAVFTSLPIALFAIERWGRV